MKGFFKNITKIAVRKNPSPSIKTCADCPLKDQECANQPVSVIGEGKKKVLILTGTMNLKKQNIQRLENELRRAGIDMEEDCVITSVVQSKKPFHKITVKNEEKEISDSRLYVECCRIKILNFIKEFQPQVIIALGDRVMNSLVKHRSNFRGQFPDISRWESNFIPDQEYLAWIVPTWSIPSLEENEEKDNGILYSKRFRKSLKEAARLIGIPIPKRDDKSLCKIILDEDKALEEISKCRAFFDHNRKDKDAILSFDYETTGLKPWAKEQKIICISMCYQPDKSVAFMMTKKIGKALKEQIFEAEYIKKVSHNAQFEHIWTKVKLDAEVKGWKRDTLLDAHILDNRSGTVGLKLQTYLNFGIAGYDEEVDVFLEAKGSNDINKIQSLPPKTVLTYCALDSLYTYWLTKEQDKKFNALFKKYPIVRKARRLFMEGTIALARQTINGVRIDVDKVKQSKEEILKRIEELNQEILKDPIVKQWKKRMGPAFNLNSTPQLEHTLYTQLGIESEKKTKSGKNAVDKKTISEFNVPFIEKMIEQKELKKMMSTYLDAYLYEMTDGIMHPFFTLSGPKSFRSSSHAPNLQNISKHNPFAKKVCRQAIMARSKEHCFFEVDYKSMEVGIGQSYHQDQNMLKYLKGHGDMHRDAAIDCFLLNDCPEQMTKNLRQGGKNGFVFPEFYGDYYGNCAKAIWKTWVQKEKLADGTPVLEHFKRNGIKNFKDFSNHMKKVEEILHFERFPDFFQWRKDQYEQYLKDGHIISKTGFPYMGIMDLNDTANYGIQGSAFHCLLWDLIQIEDELPNIAPNSGTSGEIHDSILGNVHISEINTVFNLLQEVMVDRLLATHEWITAPISIDIEMSHPGGSWVDIKPIEKMKKPCSCGLEWGWTNKDNSFTCPICGETNE